MSNTLPIVLHIGTPKTGSTSLQEALFTSKSLESNGYIYCSNLGETNLADIPLAALHHDELYWDNANLEKRGYIGQEARARFWDEVKARLTTNRLKALDASGRPEKVLLASSETFWFLSSPYHFERLKLLFDQCNIHVAEVHVYLRPQIELLQSSLSTMARDGWLFDVASFGRDWLTHDIFNYLNYYDRLRSWRDTFDKASIKVHLFNEFRSDLVGHFFKSLGLGATPSTSRRMNKGLDLKGLQLVLSINKIFDSTASFSRESVDIFRMTNTPLADMHDRLFLVEAVGRLFEGSVSLDPQSILLANNYYADQNARLIEEFMPESPLSCLDSMC